MYVVYKYVSRLLHEKHELFGMMESKLSAKCREWHNYLDPVIVKAFSFTAESMPEQLNPASQQCGLNRCAQVLLYTHDSVVFEISPIVNLSAGLVTQNIGY